MNVELYVIGRVSNYFVVSIDGSSKIHEKIMNYAKDGMGYVNVEFKTHMKIHGVAFNLQYTNGVYQIRTTPHSIPIMNNDWSDDINHLMEELSYKEFVNVLLVPGYDKNMHKDRNRIGFFSTEDAFDDDYHY